MNVIYKPIDRDTAYRAHTFTSFSPEKRAEQEIATHKELFDNLVTDLGDFFTQEHADKLHRLYTDYMQSHANVMSSMITGPANFPTSRNRKRSDWADNKRSAVYEYYNNLHKWQGKESRKQAIEAAGGELAVARAKLESMKAFHEQMKAANKIIRLAPRDEINTDKIEALRGLGLTDKVISDITKTGSWHGVGFASFSLTNSNARIKGMKARVIELESREAAKESGIEAKIVNIPGGKVSFDYAENRINVKHDEKPERAIIDIVKSHGFRWSRNYGQWTRKLTNNAESSAISLIKELRAREEVTA